MAMYQKIVKAGRPKVKNAEDHEEYSLQQFKVFDNKQDPTISHSIYDELFLNREIEALIKGEESKEENKNVAKQNDANQNDAIEQSMKGKPIIPEGTTIYKSSKAIINFIILILLYIYLIFW